MTKIFAKFWKFHQMSSKIVKLWPDSSKNDLKIGKYHTFWQNFHPKIGKIPKFHIDFPHFLSKFMSNNSNLLQKLTNWQNWHKKSEKFPKKSEEKWQNRPIFRPKITKKWPNSAKFIRKKSKFLIPNFQNDHFWFFHF